MKHFIAILLALLSSFAIADVAAKIQQGSSLMESGDLDGARKLLQEALAENPGSGPANLLLGQIALQQFQWKEAEERLKAATTLQTRRPHLAWQMLGRLYLLKHNYAQSADAFNQSLDFDPKFAPALVGRARAQIFLNQIDEAIADLKQLPDASEAQSLYAQILIYQNENDQAKAVLHSISENFPAAKWLLLAIEKGNEQQLSIILAENLGNPEAYLAGAIYFRNHGVLQKSVSLLKIAYQLDDQNPVPLLLLKSERAAPPSLPHVELIQRITEAKRLLDEDKLEDAQRTAKLVVDSCELCVPGHLILIDIAERKGQYWDAVEQYEKIRGWLPELPVILIRIANIERAMKAYSLAECTVGRAISIEPANGSLYYLLAQIQNGAAKIDAAIESAKKATALGDQSADVYVLLGNLYYQKMQLAESVEAMEKAIALDPQSAEKIASFPLAVLTGEDRPGFRALLERNVEIHPDSVNTIYALGVTYFNEQNLTKAKEYFERLQNLIARKSEIYYNLALIYQREGNQSGGEAAIARFRELKLEEQKEFNDANEAHRLRDQARETLKSGDSAKAISMFSTLVSGKFSETSDLIELAKAYQLQKDNQNAYACYLKALAGSPADKDALNGAIETADDKQLAERWRARLALLSKC